MVLLSGVFNNLRSMITGRYAIEPERPPAMSHHPSPPALPSRLQQRAPAASSWAAATALVQDDSVQRVLRAAEIADHDGAARAAVRPVAGARVHRSRDVAGFRSNGTSMPDSDDYARLLERQVRRLAAEVGGLVQTPLDAVAGRPQEAPVAHPDHPP